MKAAALMALIAAAALAGWAQTTSSKHSITVKFTYDFRQTPACSGKVKKHCVMQFNVYDLSAGYNNRAKLFSIPVEAPGEPGMKEITGTSPVMPFESGKHLIGVAAQAPDKTESDPRGCKIWVEVP